MGEVEVVSILITVVVTQLHKFVKNHQSVHLKKVKCTAYKSYLNKQKKRKAQN